MIGHTATLNFATGVRYRILTCTILQSTYVFFRVYEVWLTAYDFFFFFYVQANNSITYASLDHDKYKQFDGFDI